jgi:pimeloyl-ACP methyl ester carboxylesterase
VREQAAKQFFAIIAPSENEANFYRAYLKELFSYRLNKEDIMSTYKAMIDYMQRDFSADELTNWEGQMLIINSDNDATFGEEAQQTLYSFYPQAKTQTFEGAGHSPGSTHREEFFRVVREFFS